MRMPSKPAALTVLALSTAMSAPLCADKIFFTDSRDPVERGNVIADTMRRVEWKGVVSGNALPWEIERFQLDRSRGKDTLAFEEAWSKAISAGSRAVKSDSNPLPLIEDLNTALNMTRPQPYPDSEGAELRLRYYLVWANVSAGKDPAEAYAAFKNLNIETSKTIVRTKSVTPTNRKVENGDYKGIDFAHLHSFTVEALVQVARWHLSKGDLENAWKEGFEPAIAIGEGARAAFTNDQYSVRYAIPYLKEAADMYVKHSTPDFKRAAETYDHLSRVAQAIRDDATFNWARLRGARCSINQGDNTSAERVYNAILKPWEDGKRANGPADRRFDWITPDKATSYAQALVGRGLIAAKAGRDMDALKVFSEALSFYSADREARAEALFEAAMCNVRMAANAGNKQEYYRKSAEAYQLELSLVMSDTEAGKKEGALKDAIRAIGKKS